MGDPAGVGPEICLRVLADEAIARECVPVIFGDAVVLRRVAEAIDVPLKAPVVDGKDWIANAPNVKQPSVLDWKAIDSAAVEPGVVNATTGRAAFEYVSRAIDTALAGQVVAVA